MFKILSSCNLEPAIVLTIIYIHHGKRVALHFVEVLSLSFGLHISSVWLDTVYIRYNYNNNNNNYNNNHNAGE